MVYPTKSLLALSLVERGENWTQSPEAESNKDREKHCANPPTLPVCTIWAICVWMCPTLTVCQTKNELDGGLRWWHLFMLLLKLSERKTTLKYVLPLFSFSQCVCWCARGHGWARRPSAAHVCEMTIFQCVGPPRWQQKENVWGAFFLLYCFIFQVPFNSVAWRHSTEQKM